MASPQYEYAGAAATCSHTGPRGGNTGSGRDQLVQLQHPIMEQTESDASLFSFKDINQMLKCPELKLILQILRKNHMAGIYCTW